MAALCRAPVALLCLAIALAPCSEGLGLKSTGHPLNFTAVKNGDWWKEQKMKLSAELAKNKLESDKKAAVKKAENMEKRKVEEEKAHQVRMEFLESQRVKHAEWVTKHREEAATLAEQRKQNLAVKAEENRKLAVERQENEKKVWKKRAGDAKERLFKSLTEAKEGAMEIKQSLAEQAANSSLLNGDIFTRPPTTTPPPICVQPYPGEKVVYFVHSSLAEDVLDGVLTPDGEALARSLRDHPNATVALGSGNGRVTLVITGASRKALQTAIFGLKDALPDAYFEVDPDIELRHAGEPSPAFGTQLLEKLGQQDLLAQYKRQIGVDHGGHENLWQNYAMRWHNFLDRLRKRPEQNIIIVTDKWNLAMTGLQVIPGSMGIANMRANPDSEDPYGDKNGESAWRHLSGPDCWLN